MKKILKYTFYTILALLTALVIYLVVNFPPLMAGMAAKTMCSCVYVMDRSEQSVRDNELTVFPGLSGATIEMNADSSVTAHVLGRSRTAVYRKGVGCTLLAEHTSQELRQQKINLPTPPTVSQDSIAWPMGDLVRSSLMPGVNYDRIGQAVDSAFLETNPKKPINTLGVVVVYDGQIVGEKYKEGLAKDSRMMGWSMTKSITNALVGMLVRDGKLHLDEPAPVSEWQNDERKVITLNNLLQASTGLEWDESYLLPGDFHTMFMNSDDKGGYAASKKLKYKPNEVFEYSSGTTNILSRIVRQQVGDVDYYQFPYERLFYKIGMNHALMEPDASGTFVGSSYCYATARDWARFGLLYLNDGIWEGERILPEGWVTYSSTPAAAAKAKQYGAQWWLNNIPGIPADAMIAEGFERQYVIVMPSMKLVIVRLGVTHNENFNVAGLVNGVIRGLPPH